MCMFARNERRQRVSASGQTHQQPPPQQHGTTAADASIGQPQHLPMAAVQATVVTPPSSVCSNAEPTHAVGTVMVVPAPSTAIRVSTSQPVGTVMVVPSVVVPAPSAATCAAAGQYQAP